MAVLENSLSPVINETVPVGTPVTFSGSSGAPVTFAVASSAALLSSPDIDSGLGTLRPGTSSYAFTSTQATTTPGVIVYWDASFSSATLDACEGVSPTTYTTAMHTFTVISPLPVEAEANTKRKQEEEAAFKKKQEEEKAVATSAACSVSLTATNVAVQSSGMALVKLNCVGIVGTHGMLTLTAKGTVRATGKKKRARTVTIGTGSFSIAGDETKTVKVDLNAAGRALLSTNHGRLSADLSIIEQASRPENAQTKAVRLIQREAAKKTKR
jgi:hypothetical protein